MSKSKESGDGSSGAKRRAFRRADAVDKAITAFEESLEEKPVTLGEYLRLVQLQKEIDGDEPKDIEVTWKEHDETKSSDK